LPTETGRESSSEWEAAAEAHTIRRASDGYGWGLFATTRDAEAAERIARDLAKARTYSRMPWVEITATVLARVGDASLPALIVLFDHAPTVREGPAAGDIAKIISCVTTLDAARALAKHIDHKQVRPVLLQWVEAHPALGVAAVAEVVASRGKAVDSARRALQQVLRAHGDAKTEAKKLVSATEDVLLEELSAGSTLPEASAKELPAVLVSPWLGARKSKPHPTVTGLVLPKRAERVVWQTGERERAKDSGIDWDLMENWKEVPKGEKRGSPKMDAHVAKKVAAARADNWSSRVHFVGTLLAGMSEGAALALWNGLEDMRKLDPSAYDVRKILAEYETKALPGLLRAAEAWPLMVLPELVHVDSPRLAAPMADALARMKKVGPVARSWLLAFPETAALALVPLALDGTTTSRDAAQGALRVLEGHGKRDVVSTAATHHGVKADAAVREILAFDPLDDLPTKMPAAPKWMGPLSAPRLRDAKNALPESAVAHLVTMLAISTLESPYPGIALVKAACDARSLAELSWDLFLAWSLAGSPSKDDWALAGLGLIGDDACARRLTPRIREWPGEGGHARAVKGLDVLAAIGSDIALMHLDAIATKVKFKGLQEKARERISAVAEARGLTRDELADRLVPDLDLDEDGSRTLSFGPRTFRVG
jgi:hypothetical protein